MSSSCSTRSRSSQSRSCRRRVLAALRRLTVPPLVQTLPYVAWILLATLAFGGFAFVVVTRQLSDVTTGYVRFMAGHRRRACDLDPAGYDRVAR